MTSLRSQKALVTGSTRGIGLAIAQELHAQGCHVALNGRSPDDLDAAARLFPEKDVVKICGDITNPEACRAIMHQAKQALGRIDIVVCNVGNGSSVPPGQETYEEWQRVFGINLWSTTNTVEAVRTVLNNACKSIVCVSSICGTETIPGAPVTYSAAKAALNAYVKGISRPLGAVGVRINAVAPGNVLFDGSVWHRKMADDAQAVEDMLQSNVPLNRLGTPEEIAKLVAWLSSDEAQFITGTVVVADGGQSRS